MTALEAIKILQAQRPKLVTAEDYDYSKALLLGIQALIRHSNSKHLTFTGMLLPLPGETEV